MKGLKISLVFVVATLIAIGLTDVASAFHSGGVAECEGCHSMHSPAPGGSYLLVGTTKSETCLTCHENANDTGPSSYHISTATAALAGSAPKQRTPGGDFGWIKKTFTYTYSGTTYNETGGGHNINAPAYGYSTDARNAPGGSFPGANLECNSCHDPHGQYRRLLDGTIAKTGAPIWASGSYRGTNVADNEPKTTGEAVGVYRLLAGAGYTKNGVTFGGVPAAKVPSSYNRTESTTQTRAAYGSATSGGHVEWGRWCATCHGNMHSNNGSRYVHPTDEGLGSPIADLYNQYVKSGDLTGVASSSFLSLVPFIENTADYTTLAGHAFNNDSQLGGPGSTDRVSCLSCHRTHASGFSHMLRFDQGYEFMTKGGQYIGSDNPEITGSRAPLQHRGRTNADWTAAYYDRPATKFATYQRVLCNKCHAKD